MDNQELPLTEQDSRAKFSEAESPVTVPALRQQSSSSQPEILDEPSFSSTEDEKGATGNETDKTSFEDEPKFDSPEPISLSLSGTLERLTALITMIYVEGQNSGVRFLAMGSRRVSEQRHPVIEWEDSDIGRDLVDRLWDTVTNVNANPSLSPTLVITDRERIFLEEFVQCVPYEIRAAIRNELDCPPSTFIGPLPEFENSSLMRLPSGRSIVTLEMALAHILMRELIAEGLSETSESDASTKLCNLPASLLEVKNWVLEHFEPREDCCERESSTMQDALKDSLSHESPQEAQPSEVELTRKKNADDPILDVDPSAQEALDHELANLMKESLDAPPEESSEESPGGTQAKESKKHFTDDENGSA